MEKALSVLLVLLAGCSAVGLFAPAFWAFDLFNHFRIQALLGGVLLFAISLFVDRRLVLAASVVVLLNAGLLATRLYDATGIDLIDSTDAPWGVASHIVRKGEAISIVSANVLSSNTNYQALLTMVEREQPDVLVLTEVNDRWINNLDGLKQRYPYRLIHPRQDNFGMAVYAKEAFAGRFLSVGDYQLPLAEADFRKFVVLVAHPIPPLSRQSMVENKHYLNTVAERANAYQGAVVVAGDLNSTLWSNAVVPLLDANLKMLNPLGVAYTWPSQSPLLAIQIDHFFVRNIVAGNFRVLEDIGSDHFPIQSTVLFTR